MGIKIKDLNYIYMQGTPFEKHALKDINLEISDGEFIGLIGHTGSGKSTLIQHFNGLLEPHSGSVYVNGADISKKGVNLLDVRHKIGLVFQYPEHQIFEETVGRDIAFGPKNMGLSDNEIKERVLEAMRYVELDESYADKSPFDLSGGQKRRVAIAGVMAMRPSVLILDEPAAGLDPAGKNEIMGQIKKLHDANKITVIFVSHSMEAVASIANRIIVMHKGTIAMDGTPQQIFARGEELVSMGLDIPQINKLVRELERRGVNINTDIFTVRDAAKTIAAMIGKKEGE